MNDIGSNIPHYSNLIKSNHCQKIGLFISAEGLLEGEFQSTTYIRFISTFQSLTSNFSPCIINVADRNEMKAVKNDLLNDNFSLDIVIIERIAFESIDFLKLLIRKCKSNDIKIIYEVDDDLINIDKNHNHYDYYHEKIPGIRYLLENSNVIVVSTNNLKNKFINLNENIIVIPNVLAKYWDVDIKHPKKQNNIIKIGYMGTFSHNNDLKLLKDPINLVKEYFKSKGMTIIFELIGGTPEEIDWAQRIEFTGKDRPYPNFIKFLKSHINWDIAVAPLEYSNINLSKSHLKYLEYTALGIPCVYSDIGPYKENIIHRHNGLLVKHNSPKKWANNIITLIEDEILRNNIINNSLMDINYYYSINTSLEMWENVLKMCSRK